MREMPEGITHVVQVLVSEGGDQAYVLLAIEVGRGKFYLDENVCDRAEDGSWLSGASGGGGWTDQTLDELREHPPRQGMLFT